MQLLQFRTRAGADFSILSGFPNLSTAGFKLCSAIIRSLVLRSVVLPFVPGYLRASMRNGLMHVSAPKVGAAAYRSKPALGKENNARSNPRPGRET